MVNFEENYNFQGSRGGQKFLGGGGGGGGHSKEDNISIFNTVSLLIQALSNEIKCMLLVSVDKKLYL